MIIDNLEILDKIIKFEPNTFYKFVVLLRRKDKQKNILSDYSKKELVVKSWWISNQEQLDKALPDMKTYCKLFNARLYMATDRKSLMKVIVSIQKQMLETMGHIYNSSDNDINSYTKAIRKIPDSCASLAENTDTKNKEKNKWWLFDIDTKDEDQLSSVKSAIFASGYTGDTIIMLPTKSGYHILTERSYNGKALNGFFKDNNISCEVNDNALTLLYMVEEERDPTIPYKELL